MRQLSLSHWEGEPKPPSGHALGGAGFFLGGWNHRAQKVSVSHLQSESMAWVKSAQAYLAAEEDHRRKLLRAVGPRTAGALAVARAVGMLRDRARSEVAQLLGATITLPAEHCEQAGRGRGRGLGARERGWWWGLCSERGGAGAEAAPVWAGGRGRLTGASGAARGGRAGQRRQLRPVAAASALKLRSSLQRHILAAPLSAPNSATPPAPSSHYPPLARPPARPPWLPQVYNPKWRASHPLEDCLTNAWVGHGRWLLLDLTAQKGDYGPALGGDGVVTAG